jgi:phosphatidate phosphatase APP1
MIKGNGKTFAFALLFGFLLLQLDACSANTSTLKRDENIMFFPTAANRSVDGNWNVPVHHWVFEKEQGNLSRKFTTKIISELFEGMGVSEKQAHSALFKQRLMWFLVDNHRKKQINILLANKPQKLALTVASGHAISYLKLPLSTAKPSQWLTYKAIVPARHKRGYAGAVQFIPRQGLTVISDIDDTIKVSEVLDKKALIKNTFVEPYRATQGFPEYYKRLKNQGAYFHYVSASPWQLYPSLKPFLDEYYPKGTVSLRNFRIKDSSLIKFLQSSFNYKVRQIKRIIRRYPGHQFILIGDSGEHDPEVYAKIYQMFPKNIKAIQIRAVAGSDLSAKRFQNTFARLPKSLWSVFTTPGEHKPGGYK